MDLSQSTAPGERPIRRACCIALTIVLLLTMPGRAQPRDDVVQSRSGSIRVTLVETGEVRAKEARSVAAPFEWREALQLIELVPEGSLVDEGDTLARFDAAFLDRQIAEVTAEIQDNEAELRRIRAEQASRLLTMKNAVRRAEFSVEQWTLSLEKMNYESELKRQEARLSLRKAEVSLKEAQTKLSAQTTLDSLEVAAAELKVANGRLRLEEEYAQVRSMTLVAPIGGLVVYGEIGPRDNRRRLRMGDEISPGANVIQIPNLEQMEVVFRVHEVDRERVSEGTPALVTLEADPSQKFDARVEQIAKLALAPESDSPVRHFEVRAAIQQTDAALKPGLTATVTLQTQVDQTGVVVPLQAVHEVDGRAVVFPESSWPRPQEISLGARDHFDVLVRDGLAAGVDLVASPPLDREDVEPLGYLRFRRLLETTVADETVEKGMR